MHRRCSELSRKVGGDPKALAYRGLRVGLPHSERRCGLIRGLTPSISVSPRAGEEFGVAVFQGFGLSHAPRRTPCAMRPCPLPLITRFVCYSRDGSPNQGTSRSFLQGCGLSPLDIFLPVETQVPAAAKHLQPCGENCSLYFCFIYHSPPLSVTRCTLLFLSDCYCLWDVNLIFKVCLI